MCQESKHSPAGIFSSGPYAVRLWTHLKIQPVQGGCCPPHRVLSSTDLSRVSLQGGLTESQMMSQKVGDSRQSRGSSQDRSSALSDASPEVIFLVCS